MPRLARDERHALADTLLAVGPQAPTECAGWTSRDLAAHIVLRDRKPFAAVGILVPPLAGVTARAQRRLADGDYGALVGAVRRGPAFSPTRLGPVDEAMNLVEFFVHHEDVRRAQPAWRPRSLEVQVEANLWRRVPMLARLRLRKLPGAVAVRAPGHGELTVGKGHPVATLVGTPGELLLFLFGRKRVARATVDGPEPIVRRLKEG